MKDHKQLAEEGVRKWYIVLINRFGPIRVVHPFWESAKECYRMELEGIIAANPTKIVTQKESLEEFTQWDFERRLCNKEHYKEILKELDKL